MRRGPARSDILANPPFQLFPVSDAEAALYQPSDLRLIANCGSSMYECVMSMAAFTAAAADPPPAFTPTAATAAAAIATAESSNTKTWQMPEWTLQKRITYVAGVMPPVPFLPSASAAFNGRSLRRLSPMRSVVGPPELLRSPNPGKQRDLFWIIDYHSRYRGGGADAKSTDTAVPESVQYLADFAPTRLYSTPSAAIMKFESPSAHITISYSRGGGGGGGGAASLKPLASRPTNLKVPPPLFSSRYFGSVLPVFHRGTCQVWIGNEHGMIANRGSAADLRSRTENDTKSEPAASSAGSGGSLSVVNVKTASAATALLSAGSAAAASGSDDSVGAGCGDHNVAQFLRTAFNVIHSLPMEVIRIVIGYIYQFPTRMWIVHTGTHEKDAHRGSHIWVHPLATYTPALGLIYPINPRTAVIRTSGYLTILSPNGQWSAQFSHSSTANTWGAWELTDLASGEVYYTRSAESLAADKAYPRRISPGIIATGETPTNVCAWFNPTSTCFHFVEYQPPSGEEPNARIKRLQSTSVLHPYPIDQYRVVCVPIVKLRAASESKTTATAAVNSAKSPKSVATPIRREVSELVDLSFTPYTVKVGGVCQLPVQSLYLTGTDSEELAVASATNPQTANFAEHQRFQRLQSSLAFATTRRVMIFVKAILAHVNPGSGVRHTKVLETFCPRLSSPATGDASAAPITVHHLYLVQELPSGRLFIVWFGDSQSTFDAFTAAATSIAAKREANTTKREQQNDLYREQMRKYGDAISRAKATGADVPPHMTQYEKPSPHPSGPEEFDSCVPAPPFARIWSVSIPQPPTGSGAAKVVTPSAYVNLW